jgi:HlyD family secretion protein
MSEVIPPKEGITPPATQPVPPVQSPSRPARAGKKKKKRKGLIIGIALALLVGIVLTVVLTGRKETGIAVEVETVTSHSIVQTVTATGVIDPEVQVKVASEVSGEIVYLSVKEGDQVSKGQVIVRINPEAMLAQLDEARAQISSAQAREAQASAGLMRSQQELARLQQLFDKKLATAQELEAAQSQVKIGRAELDAAGFQTQQVRAGLRRVQESLNRTTIVAPMSGTVTKLNSKLGEKVVGAQQMSGTEIMTIADLSVIEAVVDVSETDVVQVSLGDVAEVEVDAIPGQKFKAVVSRIANSPKQSNTGTQEQLTNFEVRLRFISPDDRFRPGMTSTATIQTDSKSNVLAVPIQAVTTRKKEKEKEVAEGADEDAARNVKLEQAEKEEKPVPIVFLKQGDSVVARPVTTGIRDDRYIEILGGLKPGEVVVKGSYKAIAKDLENGSKITIADRPATKSKSDSKGK